MITKEDLRRLEEESEKQGISKVQLMENAGKGLFKALQDRMELKNKKILIVAYHGNNGGDGFVAARHLCETSDVTVCFVGDESKFKEETKLNYKKIDKNPMIQMLFDVEDIDFDDFDIIIDAILGIGVFGELKDPIASIVAQMNSSGAFKVAVDVPTGINPDGGYSSETFFNADLIVTFHDIKPGLMNLQEKVEIVDIGIKGA